MCVQGRAVALHVRFQTVALGEGLVAEGALIWPLSVVGPHVDRQVFLTSTRFATNWAHKKLDAQVASHVVVQVRLAFEEAAALGAAVGRFVGVDAHVGIQFAVGYEAFVAYGAGKRPVVAVRLHVGGQAAARHEGLAADVAEVRPLSHRVDLLVRLQRVGEFEALPADLAAVAPLPRVSGPVAS